MTLAVADLERSIVFYRDLLGFGLRARWDGGAYLEAGALWLCLSVDPAVRTGPHADYTHVALTVADRDFELVASRVRAAAPIWKNNTSEGASLYFLDPDGHKMELHVGDLAARLAAYRASGVPGRQIFE